MSTKIWEAYRLKEGVDLWGFVQDIRPKVQKRITKKLYEISGNLIERTKEKKDLRVEVLKAYGISDPEKSDREITHHETSRWLFERYREATMQPYKDVWDFDVSIVFVACRGRWLLVPFPGSGLIKGMLDCLKKDKRLEDYHYQDQVDEDEAPCSDEEWEQRKKDWNEVLDDAGCFSDKLTLELCCLGQFTRLTPDYHEMLKKISKAMKKERKTT